MKIEIDNKSGFCHGVTSAIRKAEQELAQGESLYCLGDIVHNDREVERLHSLGLQTIDHATFQNLQRAKVMFRAHGEPPQIYARAEENHIALVDATCPVVLQLQRRVKLTYTNNPQAQIVIFGKPGHAEVVGLVGQTDGHAVVVQSVTDADRLDFTRDTYLFSQTTMSLDGFHALVEFITNHIQAPAIFQYADTICRQVINRLPNIRQFASKHDVILFVAGQKSSNGKMLFEAAKQVNPHTFMVGSPDDINRAWFDNAESVGICGATSTPKWLMERCRDMISEF
ncbi:MAG: 4-hydroxy-3-methylbut-2-enyl diphosphate reductase [Alloprevotella sp.]|nr:4-hydroxy-3-methylbut-2-enyl diphosphate reductase [Alloprevotella sp.]